MSYTAHDARRDFTPRLRRSHLFALASRFGVTRGTVRLLLKESVIPPIHYRPKSRAYYDLETTLNAFLPAAKAKR